MSNGEYNEMIEIPVSSCEMIMLPTKKKRKKLRKKTVEAVKRELFKEPDIKEEEILASSALFYQGEESESNQGIEKSQESKTKRKLSFDIITAQVAAIFILSVGIIVTNIFWEDSGINTLLKSVFSGSEAVQTDTRTYSEFYAFAPTLGAPLELDGGIMTVSGKGAVYSPCDGEVEVIAQVDGKYNITVKHSDVFKSVIRGVDFAYQEVGEKVFRAVPVGYFSEGVQVLLYNDNTLVTNYTVADGNIVWQS